MTERTLVLNAGSSSLKFALFAWHGDDEPDLVLRGQIEAIGGQARFHVRAGPRRSDLPRPPEEAEVAAVRDHEAAVAVLLDWLDAAAGIDVAAAGHRIVHGGARYAAPLRLSADVLDDLASLSRLAPHHLPCALAAVRALAARRADLPQVACFDTAFHAGQPAVASRLPLPRALHDQGVRRYGFHGLSYESVTQALARHHPDGRLPRRLIAAHLGNGASLCAIEAGRSIATTMGFSTLDGLMMATRCGALDPGVVLYLLREEKLDLAALHELLYNRSGLLGVSGLSADLRALLASDRPEAAEAIELYCYRALRELGSLIAALGGLDALVFTGGVGENAAPIRARICVGLRWLGLELDETANACHGPSIAALGSRIAAWVIPTDEELVIARHTRALVAS